MSGFRTPEISRQQLVLWERRLEDALPDDHQVRHLVFLLHSEAFAGTFCEMERSYVLDRGKPPYNPRDLTALYLYGMLHRIRSSRQLEDACQSRLDVIWLMQGQTPDHSTIADFVGKYGPAQTIRGMRCVCVLPSRRVVLQESREGPGGQSGSIRGSS